MPITSLGIYIYILGRNTVISSWRDKGFVTKYYFSFKIITQISCCILLSTMNTRKLLCHHGYWQALVVPGGLQELRWSNTCVHHDRTVPYPRARILIRQESWSIFRFGGHQKWIHTLQTSDSTINLNRCMSLRDHFRSTISMYYSKCGRACHWIARASILYQSYGKKKQLWCTVPSAAKLLCLALPCLAQWFVKT